MSDRKVGNNKEACKRYASAHRLERNKERNKKRQDRREIADQLRIERRLAMGKALPSRHQSRALGTHMGTWYVGNAHMPFKFHIMELGVTRKKGRAMVREAEFLAWLAKSKAETSVDSMRAALRKAA